jgi:class 3 adenylate cyclase
MRGSAGNWAGSAAWSSTPPGTSSSPGFAGPARGIRCAVAIREALRELGLEVRLGLHTGECEALDGKVAGIAVSIGARVSALAAAGEVLVSQTVKDLVAGSGITFEDRGVQRLKDVPGEWRLYSAAAA